MVAAEGTWQDMVRGEATKNTQKHANILLLKRLFLVISFRALVLWMLGNLGVYITYLRYLDGEKLLVQYKPSEPDAHHLIESRICRLR